jgi:hypothetical protein
MDQMSAAPPEFDTGSAPRLRSDGNRRQFRDMRTSSEGCVYQSYKLDRSAGATVQGHRHKIAAARSLKVESMNAGIFLRSGSERLAKLAKLRMVSEEEVVSIRFWALQERAIRPHLEQLRGTFGSLRRCLERPHR